jgi:pimeloyl-ACP methyl ester carboxylesterase
MPTIRTDDSAVIVYRDSGQGMPAILLHCSASCGGQWSALTSELASSYRVLAPDLFGCGGTDRWAGWRPLTLAEEADTVATLIALSDEPVHLVGHSYGGAVALRVALEHPDWVRSLTVIEPVAFYLLRDGDDGDRRLFREVGTFANDVSTAVSSGNFEGAMRRFVDYWIGAGAWASMPLNRREILRRGAQQVPMQFHSVLSERTTVTAYRRLSIPTLVLRGETSPRPTRRIAEMLAWALRARLKTVPDAGHMMPVTHSDEVNALVVDHIVRNTAARAAPFAA